MKLTAILLVLIANLAFMIFDMKRWDRQHKKRMAKLEEIERQTERLFKEIQ